MWMTPGSLLFIQKITALKIDYKNIFTSLKTWSKAENLESNSYTTNFTKRLPQYDGIYLNEEIKKLKKWE
jgi:hypothetical protein